ncbi:MAG: hypothetical protein QM779_09955 [Propionicimonas sp.]|uniref:hypothetical protein n=1 Tax=Propionicimonas sp. TaxID=1955623 RepID=UPI003D142790
MGAPQRTWVWFGAAAATMVTLVGLNKAAATPAAGRQLAVLEAESLARWFPEASCGAVEDHPPVPLRVAGGTRFTVLRRRLVCASAEDARRALVQARATALRDGWLPRADCGWEKAAAKADLGLHLDGATLVITLRSFRRPSSPADTTDDVPVGVHH